MKYLLMIHMDEGTFYGMSEAEQQKVCLQSDDMREAITAIVEFRDPVYRGK